MLMFEMGEVLFKHLFKITLNLHTKLYKPPDMRLGLTNILTFILILTVSKSLVAQQQQRYVVEKLHDKINTQEFDEISPVISIDGQTLFFTRAGSYDFNKTLWIDGVDVSEKMSYQDLAFNLKNIYSEIAGYPIKDAFRSDFNQDIWYAETVEKHLDHMVHPPSPLNNALPNSICSITNESDAYVVVNQFSKEGGMNKGFSIVKQNPDGTWTDPQPMQIDGYDVISSAISLTMSSDGKVLIMSLPRKDSYGNNDLYLSMKIGDNHWSAPKNMGAKINTAFKEVTPNLTADSKDLFFASDRPGTEGGLDLYYMTRLDDTWENWSEPRRFVSPINSSADESQPYYNYATGYLYFSSKKDGTSDIYRAKIAPDVPQEVLVRGKIINAQTGLPVDGKVLFGSLDSTYYERYMETIEGYFLIKVKQGKPIKMTAHKPGYINHEVVVNFNKGVYYNQAQEITLLVDSVAENVNISLNPVYFKRSTPIIQKDSYVELEYLADVLKRFPEIHILIEGHTDNSGTPETRQKLSEDRALEVKRFLIRSRINPKRVETIGYGGSKPLSDNKAENSRELNRRVEVKITKIKYGL
jgi:outer membrane protein OmpA-like peptidoglycan-associated protein